MNNTGWIKLHRSIKDNPKLLKGINFALWCYILISVVHNEEQNVLLAGNIVTLQPGQGVFSTPDLANKLGFSVSGIRRALNWLESEQQIEQQKTTKGTVITVVNWDRYQNIEQQNEQQLNNNRTTTEQQLNNLPYYKKNNKNNKNNNNLNNTNVLLVDPEIDEPAEEGPKFGKLQPIVDAWNSLPLQNILSLNGTRLKLLNARIKEYGFDEVIHGITMIRNSKFLLGQNNKGWQITFDWLIKPTNFGKVLEGNYDDNKKGARTVPQGKNDTFAGYQRMMELLGSDEDEQG